METHMAKGPLYNSSHKSCRQSTRPLLCCYFLPSQSVVGGLMVKKICANGGSQRVTLAVVFLLFWSQNFGKVLGIYKGYSIPDLFKLVYYVAHTSIEKRVVRLLTERTSCLGCIQGLWSDGHLFHICRPNFERKHSKSTLWETYPRKKVPAETHDMGPSCKTISTKDLKFLEFK